MNMLNQNKIWNILRVFPPKTHHILLFLSREDFVNLLDDVTWNSTSVMMLHGTVQV